MGAGVTLDYPALWRAPRARRQPIAFACAASLLAHLWAAHELPAGAPRAAGATRPLVVRLQPRAQPLSPGQLTVRDSSSNAAPAARAAAAPEDKPGAASTRNGGKRAQSRRANDAGGIAPADATYYPARELDVYPALLAPLTVRYPERERPHTGRALVMLLVDAAGKVNDVTVVESDPPGRFEEAARETFQAAVFSAARRNGMPVRSRVLIHLEFDPRAATAQ